MPLNPTQPTTLAQLRASGMRDADILGAYANIGGNNYAQDVIDFVNQQTGGNPANASSVAADQLKKLPSIAAPGTLGYQGPALPPDPNSTPSPLPNNLSTNQMQGSTPLPAKPVAQPNQATQSPADQLLEQAKKMLTSTPGTPTASTAQPAQPQQTTYQGNSIYDYLKSTGQPTDFASRLVLARENGIQNYTGTAEQNTQLLNTLRTNNSHQETAGVNIGQTTAQAQPTVKDQIMSKLGITVDPNKSPVTSLADTYKTILSSSGYTEANNAIVDTQREYDKLKNELNDKKNEVNFNPWLTEGERQRQNAKLDDKYSGKLDILTNKLKLYQTQRDSIKQDAQFQAGLIHDQQVLDQQMTMKAMDIAEQQLEAEQKLKADNSTSDIKEYNFAKSQGYTGSFTQYQKEQANLKATIAKAGVSPVAPTSPNLNDPQTIKDLATVNQINNVLANPNFDQAFGLTGGFNTLIPGSNAQKVKADVQQVIDQLALAARGQLKGQGAVSDFEGQMLKNAQSALNFSLAPADAKQALINVRGAITTSSGGSALVRITSPDGTSKTGTANQAMITDAINKGYRVEYQ